jgi:hypothetical protein
MGCPPEDGAQCYQADPAIDVTKKNAAEAAFSCGGALPEPVPSFRLLPGHRSEHQRSLRATSAREHMFEVLPTIVHFPFVSFE